MTRFKIVIFICILVLPTLVFGGLKLFAPDTAEAFMFDLGEKREATRIESVSELMWSGEKLNEAYSDRIPFRSVLVSLFQSAEGSFEKPYEKEILPAAMSLFHGKRKEPAASSVSTVSVSVSVEPSTTSASTEPAATPVSISGTASTEDPEPAEHVHEWEETERTEPDYDNYGRVEYICRSCGETRTEYLEKLVDDSYLAPRILGEGWVLVGRSDWLFLYGNGEINYYKAKNLLSEEDMAAYLDKLERLQAICDARGTKLGVLYAPNKSEVYSEYMPSIEAATDYKRTRAFVDYIHANSDVSVSYPLDELRDAKKFWQVYYKYDSHWNNMGAFLGVQDLYSKMGLEVTDPHELDIEEVPGTMIQDLFNLGGLDAKNYPLDVGYTIPYKPEIEVKVLKDGNIRKTSSTCTNGQKIVVLGDSYREYVQDYYERDFTESVIAHRDYINSLRADIESADVIILEAVERYDVRIFKSVDVLLEWFEEPNSP